MPIYCFNCKSASCVVANKIVFKSGFITVAGQKFSVAYHK